MLQPSGRVSEPRHDEQGWYRLVFDEPLYLDVRTPRAFNKATIALTYENANQDVIELGGMVNDGAGTFILKPFEHATLEKLSWDESREGTTVLFQREKQYESLEDFFADLPPPEDVLVYRYDLGAGYDKLTPDFDIEQSDKKFLIAEYPLASVRNNLKTRTVVFDTRVLEYGFHKYRFIISAPGITKENGLALYSVHMIFEREPMTWNFFWDKVWNKFFGSRISPNVDIAT